MKTAILVLALLGLASVASGVSLVAECVTVSKCTDYIVSLGTAATGCTTSAYYLLHNASTTNNWMLSNFADVGTSTFELSPARLACMNVSGTAQIDAAWFDSAATTMYGARSLGLADPCPSPKCPYGYVPKPSNSTQECIPASGYNQPTQGKSIPAYSSLSQCLADTTNYGFVSMSVPFRVRTCMSEYNKQWKLCMQYNGMLG